VWNADVRCSLLHGNAHPSTAAHTRVLREHFNWELFDHPPYSFALAPSNYHELMEGVKTWHCSQAENFFDTGIKNLFPDMTSASVPAMTTLRIK
jgi:hypothetical protein